jgi:hypothetical protein
MDKKFIVKIDDNYHYMDESERRDGGSYSTLEDAIKRCEEITIASLEDFYKEGINAEELRLQWLMFGEDPFIIGDDIEGVPFSARNFITEELCAKVIKEFQGHKLNS